MWRRRLAVSGVAAPTRSVRRGFGRWRTFAAIAAASLAGAAATTRALGDDARAISFGRHLSAECSACHRVDGVDNGIPSITGWPASAFEETMNYYKTGQRPNQVMVSVANSLDAEQLKALAAYYGSLPKRAGK